MVTKLKSDKIAVQQVTVTNQEGYAKEEKDVPFSSCNLIDCGMLS